jgi:hypothetical protein
MNNLSIECNKELCYEYLGDCEQCQKDQENNCSKNVIDTRISKSQFDKTIN